MNTYQLDKLIVEHLTDLDVTAKRIEAIEKRIWHSMGDAIKKWLKANQWDGEYDVDDDFWVAPKSWVIDNAWEARFRIYYGPGDKEGPEERLPYWILSRMCGISGGQLCLWFDHKVGIKAWTPVAKSEMERIKDAGFFTGDKLTFYTPCTLDVAHVARAIVDDAIDDVMDTVTEALDRAKRAKLLFDQLLKKAKVI
jgi:hypothetical protein